MKQAKENQDIYPPQGPSVSLYHPSLHYSYTTTQGFFSYAGLLTGKSGSHFTES